MKEKLIILALTVTSAIGAPTEKVEKDWLDYAIESKCKITEEACKFGLPFESEVCRQGEKPRHIEIDIKGLDQLVLSVWETEDGNDYDVISWADGRFVAEDGTITWLSDIKYAYSKSSYGYISRKRNVARTEIAIADSIYQDGVFMHAPCVLTVDLRDKKWVKFISDYGIDNYESSPVASAVFRLQTTTGTEEASQLTKSYKSIGTDLLPYVGSDLVRWLTSPGTYTEKTAVENIYKSLGCKDNEFEKKINQIESMVYGREKVLTYIDLNKKLRTLRDIKVQYDMVKPEALCKAFADFSKTGGYDKEKWQLKLDEFIKLSKKEIKTLEDIETTASKVVSLAREILLSNPTICDRIIATRFRLDNRARSAMAPALGTQSNNWSCQMSAARSGFDADLVVLSNIHSGNCTENVIYKAPAGNVITDATLHWNGDRIMFTSTDSLKRFQVYEVDTAGKGFHQVTLVDESDLEFFDAQYLPSGKIVACTNIGYQGVPCVSGGDAVGNYSLYDPKTRKLRRLTFDQDNNWNATVLRNGQVMYTRWEYTDLTHYYSRIVFTMNPDGTNQRALYGSGSMFPNSTFDMQQLPGDGNRFVGIISGHHGIARSGRMMIFDPTKGSAGAEGVVQEIPHSDRVVTNLVKDQLVNGVWPQFIKPYPLDDHYFLVTAKPSQESLWGIYLVDTYDNMVLIKECEGEGFINPIPMVKRSVPAIIPETVTTDDKTATIFIQDIYEGRGLPGVPRGTIKQIRVFAYEYDYLHTMSDHIWKGIQSGWDIKRLLGYVPVEEDGSAMFKIPANTPVSLQPLDSAGRAVQWMRSWTLGMPGETVSCIGCHEQRSQTVIPKRTIASTMPPHEIEAIPGGPRAINFEQDIQPILSRACVACHGGENPAGGIDYTAGKLDTAWYGSNPVPLSKSYAAFHPYFYRQGTESEMAVLNPYEYSAFNSEMTRMLRDGHHSVELTDKEMRMIYTWLDMNLPYNNTALANPHFTLAGDTINQKIRRAELGEKYSMNVPDWEKELADYQSYLDSLPAPTAVIPKEDKKSLSRKVKGFPFDEQTARAMQGDNHTKKLELAPGVSLEFVLIPSGKYIDGRGNKVQIDNPFWMATTELSNQQLRTMIPSHDSRCIGQHWKDHTTAGYPVNADTLAATKTSLEEAEQFCRLLSEKSGYNVRIPTEQQWEWASRAGSDQDFWFGPVGTDYSRFGNMGDSQLSKMAVSGIDPQPMPKENPLYRWCAFIPRDNAVDDGNMLMTSPAKYTPNPWGLYDMNGNVCEWTCTEDQQRQGEYIVKGGSWYDKAKYCTNSSRRTYLPWIKVWNTGIRIIIEN